jgi:hypothetical protein
MKKSIFISFILILSLFSVKTYAQGFTPPAEGNAVIYLVRVTAYGGVMPFEFFHNDQFFGRITGLAYLRYEVPAGESLIWASSENKSFLDCNLEAGKTYIALVNVKMGGFTARVDLQPITENDDSFQRVKDHVNDKGPMQIGQESIDKTQKKLEDKGFIEDILKKYNDKWKNTGATTKITPEMAIPEEKLK